MFEGEAFEDKVKVLEDKMLEEKVLEDEVLGDKLLEGEVLGDKVLDDKVLGDKVLEIEVLEDKVTEEVVTAALGLEENHGSSGMTYFWSNLGSGWHLAWISLVS